LNHQQLHKAQHLLLAEAGRADFEEGEAGLEHFQSQERSKESAFIPVNIHY
jgi:hypothetical protein